MSDLFAPAGNCWRVEHASRAAFLVDAAAYFDAVATAMARARRCILMVGWDFHSETVLRPSDGSRRGLTLADHLHAITTARSQLAVHMLCWDYAPIMLLEREIFPLLQFHWKAGRVTFRFASDHPVAASHHQKIVVIDDRVAFLGGLDLTVGRWDDRHHLVDDSRRRLPDGAPYEPFHDVQLAVDGPAAGALGDLARDRWRGATGKRLAPVAVETDPWPPELAPSIQDVSVALARTQPAHASYEEAHEVERLYLDAIDAARRFIYLENQYVTSAAIGGALRRRLSEPDGPEIVIVTPREQAGRLEQATMGSLRAKLVRGLRAADRHGRLRVLCPTVDGTGVNLHAKVMIVDDVMVRIGSANLSTRSMRLDTECDAAIRLPDGDTGGRRRIADLRDGLVAEHLGRDREEVAAAVQEMGLVATIDRLRGGERTLDELAVEDEPETRELELPDELIDPARGLDEALMRHALPIEAAESSARRWPWVLGAAAALALGGAALWTPPTDWVRTLPPASVAPLLRDAGAAVALAPPAFAAASTLMAPVTSLIVIVALVFGPWTGFAVALGGSVMGAAIGYGMGRLLPRDVVRRLAGRRLNRVTRKLAQRGLVAIVAVRVVPVAPFAVTNLIAGGSRIAFGDYLLGTTLGMTPGIFLLAVLTDRAAEVVRHPRPATVAVALGALIAVILGLRWFRARLRRVGDDNRPPAPSE